LPGKRIVIVRVMTFPACYQPFCGSIMDAALILGIDLLKPELGIVRVVAMTINAPPGTLKPRFKRMGKCLEPLSMTIEAVKAPVHRIVEHVGYNQVMFRHELFPGGSRGGVGKRINKSAVAYQAVVLIVFCVKAV